MHKAIKNGIICIYPINGVAKLQYNLSLLKSIICNIHCLLDNDGEAIRALETAKSEALISSADYTFTNVRGMAESEFEDLLSIDVYKKRLEDDFGITIGNSLNGKKHKWSERLKIVFQSQGTDWSKEKVIDAVIEQLVKRVQKS